MLDRTIGILGGGQLGSMLLVEAMRFGLEVRVMDNDPTAPSVRYTASSLIGDINNFDQVVEFGSSVDIITIEREDVNVEALYALQRMGKLVYPDPQIISISQDKGRQKQFLRSHDVPVAESELVDNKEELKKKNFPMPYCLKRTSGGYDGRGVAVIRNEEDLQTVFEGPYLMEKIVDIKQEISVIVTRNETGTVECFDPVSIIMDKHTHALQFLLAPATISVKQSIEAQSLAIKIADKLKLIGVLAVEMFVTADNNLLVNEISPRPHNSGHHTIEACGVSQFGQHLRAILGLPLGNPTLLSPAITLNMYSDATSDDAQALRIAHLLRHDDVHVHWYGKNSNKMGRKMGHITIISDAMEHVVSRFAVVNHIVNNRYI